MSFKQKLNQDLKDALRNQDELRVSVLRMFLSAIANKEIELLKKDTGLAEEEFQQVLKKEIKNRKKAIEAFQKGGREDLVQKEGKEKEILEKYLTEE
jgi:uncharacterized protein YqeY